MAQAPETLRSIVIMPDHKDWQIRTFRAPKSSESGQTSYKPMVISPDHEGRPAHFTHAKIDKELSYPVRLTIAAGVLVGSVACLEAAAYFINKIQ